MRKISSYVLLVTHYASRFTLSLWLAGMSTVVNEHRWLLRLNYMPSKNLLIQFSS